MARHCKAFPLFAATLWLLLGSRGARAYEEQASLDSALGYVLIVDADERTSQGLGLDLGAGIGISDLGILRGSLGYAALVSQAELRHAGRARIEALYLLDVLQFVPFFGLSAVLVAAETSSARVSLRPGGQLLLGVDYLLSRAWLLGLDVRSGMLIEGGRMLSATDVALRVSRLFETF